MDLQDEPVRVLQVHGEPDILESASTALERHDERLVVETATSVSEGLACLESQAFECVVAHYDMPETTGIEFVRTVRGEHPNLPFIVYGGTESERIASEGFSAGVTEYLPEGPDGGRTEELVDRILSLVEQRRAREAATETEARLRIIAENANDILWMFDGDWSELRFVNSPYEAIWGRSIEELDNEPQSFLRGIHPADRDRVEAEMERLSSGESVDIEYRVNESEDFGRWVWVQGEPIITEDGTVKSIVGFARDVTDRKERERDLEAAKETHQRIIETSPVPIWVQGFEEIYYANDAAAELHGVPGAASLIGMSALEFVPAEELESARRRNDRLMNQTDTVETFVGTFHRADGKPRIAEVSASPIVYEGERAIVVAARDITAEREREAELERYETLVEVSGDPMYMLDEEGTFTYVNDAMTSITGYDEADLVGADVLTVMEASHGERGNALIESLLEDGHRRGTFEMDLVASDGTQVPVETHLSVLHGDQGDLVGTVGILRDMTERRTREQRLQRERDRLDQFAGVVSHDLRNPLAVAQGRLELASEDVSNENFEVAVDALDRMEHLIEDVLSLARAGEIVGETESIDLASLVEACWRSIASGSAELIDDTDATVSADRSRLQQLLQNLLANAVEHGGAGVTITVGDLEDGFYVVDDGPGIPPEQRDTIFDFEHALGTEGTGFGLSIVQDIADAHGWSVSVTDGESGGARFEIVGVKQGIDPDA